MCELALCCMFREETPYIREWVEYHRLVGVERFWLLNNDPDPAAAAEVAPYVDDGTAVLIDWQGGPGVKKQREGFNHVLGLARGQTKWLGFIDMDEFVVPTVAEDLREVLRDYEDFGGLGINWLCYGTSGHADPQPLQIDAYRMCAPYGHELNRNVKVIVRPERTGSVLSPHHCRFVRPWYSVGEDKATYPHTYRQASHAVVRVNHYSTRSVEDCRRKVAKWAAADSPALHEGHLDRFDRGELKDETACRFLPRLRSALGA